MAVSGWLDRNRMRAFPFLEGTEFVPNETVLDFGCVICEGASWPIAQDRSIYLSSVERSSDGNTITFTFKGSESVLQSRPLVFTRAAGSVAPEVDYAWVYDDYQRLVWYGFLITGDLSSLSLSPGASVTGTAIVEPALVRNASAHSAFRIRIANKDRTRWRYPIACTCFDSGQTFPAYWYPSGSPMSGRVRLAEGYNCVIQQNTADKLITIQGRPGAGLGIQCEQPALAENERLPPGWNSLDGAAGCNEVIRSINGIGGPKFRLIAGPGVEILDNPADHSIEVYVHLRGLLPAVPGGAPGPIGPEPCVCLSIS